MFLQGETLGIRETDSRQKGALAGCFPHALSSSLPQACEMGISLLIAQVRILRLREVQ